jgi:transcriptional regulator with XRE-family HTH domain
MDTPDQAQRARYVHTPGARQHAALARADIGLRIRELREARGLSQRQAGGDWVSRSFMSRLESGERLVGVTVLQALTLSMPDVRFVIEAGEVRIEERLDEEPDELTGAAQERTLVNDVEFG